MANPMLLPVLQWARRLRYPPLFKLTAGLFVLTRNLWVVAAHHAAWNFTILLSGLPLFPYMQIKVTPLANHPSSIVQE